MNARLYDPAAGRFLNPDPIIQAPDNTQNLNRYTYCLNNPLRYTDENGEFILGFIFGFFKGLFTGKNVFKTAWKTAVNETKIFAGLFTLDTKRGFWHALGELVSRFTWQLPQTLLGYGWTQTRNYLGYVDRVDYLGGATFATHENSSKERGITIGNYVNIDNPKSVEGKFANYVASNPLYMHEYGHYLDSQRWGPIYLFAIGAPSLINQIKHPDSHKTYWTEINANRLAKNYFGTYYGVDWSFDNYPMDKETNKLNKRIITSEYTSIDYTNL